MPDESLRLDPAAITYFGEPFVLTPVVSDILRTRYCVPGSIFLVEGVDHVSVSRSGRWQAIRLILGDGELCIQALLGSDMHRFVQIGDVALGAYVRCETFHIQWQDVGKEKMVTLVVDNLITIGWNESYRVLQKEDEHLVRERPKRIPRSRAESKSIEHPPELQDEVGEQIPNELLEQVSEEPLRDSTRWPPKPFVEDEFDDDEAAAEEAFEAFETLAFASQPKTPQKATAQVQQTPTSAQPSEPVALPRDWHDPQTPLKLTTLRSVPHLPYKQNWSCNVLAIIASISDVGPANLPPYRQRTARLADPSTSKQVHLTVFLDPEKFNPRVGSAVLLVGVKNHRFDGGSLKKYESDRKNGRWWFENPVEMSWCDVKGIKVWWSQGVESVEAQR
ncbi:cyclinlike f-box [Fusarium sporotrichioides]|uniref:Cyclinlike f-box n=1 Tax=Fusarium sporotrichioides TaxID=5514 RepID=A0A395RL78_FUSSP|nr:cyclinlike f-box [Fusarium sporotrichioides]